MKTIVLIAAGSVISFLALVLIALAILKVKPEYFGIAATPSHPGRPTVSDSAKGTVQDSAVTDNPPAQAVQAGGKSDTLLVDQLREHADSLEHQVDSLRQTLTAPKTVVIDGGQHDWTATAKLMESMNAEDAGKILKQMNDDDVKQILSKIKKRQAGKILSVLEPSRAAKILR